MAQGVKDVVLSQLWLRSLLWCRFSPWPGNFYMVQTQGKKKKVTGFYMKRTLRGHIKKKRITLSFSIKEDLPWYLFSLNENNPKRIFTFTEKSENKNSLQHLFLSELL